MFVSSLNIVQLEISSFPWYQFLVSSFLYDCSFVNDNYFVSILYCWQSMGNYNTCSSFTSFIKSSLYNLKIFIIYSKFQFSPLTSLNTFSLSESNAEVASSSNKTSGFLISALAIAIRCFCPPLNWVPLSPTGVS